MPAAAPTNLGDPLIWGRPRVLVQDGLYAAEIPETRNSHDISGVLRSLDLYEQPNQAGVRLEFSVEAIPETNVIQAGTRVLVDTIHLDPVTLGPTPTLQRAFYGIILTDERDASARSRTRDFSVYDMPSGLARTDNTLSFDGLRADEIFTLIAAGYGYGVTGTANTEVSVGRIVQRVNQSVWSFLQEALERTTEKTGKRFIIRSSGPALDKIELVEVGNTGVTWTIDNRFLLSHHFVEDAQEFRGEVNVVTESEEGDDATSRLLVRSTARIDESSAEAHLFGMFRKTIGPDGADSTEAENAARAQQELEEVARTTKRLTTDSLLIPGIRRGDTIVVLSELLGSATVWYADSVRTSYQPDGLTQALELVFRTKDVSL